MTHSTCNKLIRSLFTPAPLIMLCFVNGPVLAEEDEDGLLEEVTVTASRLRQSGFDAPKHTRHAGLPVHRPRQVFLRGQLHEV